MENTTNLKMPLLVPNQSGKEITHNEALIIIDNILQNGVIDKDLTTPPLSPNTNDVYIVGASATGVWSGKDKQLAFYDNGWRFIEPREGFTFWVNDENKLYSYDGSNWIETLSTLTVSQDLNSLSDVSISSASQYDVLQHNGTNFVNTKEIQNLSLVGINTTADSTNKLSVKSDSVLFDNATDDSRVKVNKASSSDTASHLFQSNYEGRAEFGLIGDDDFTLKVSSDGTTWNNSFVVDKTNGDIDFKSKCKINSYEIPFLKKEEIILNNDTEIIFNNLDDGYNHIFEFVNISASGNNVNLLINLSIDGVNFDTSGNYQYSAIGQSRSASKTVGSATFNFTSCNNYNSDNTDNAFRLAQNTYSGSMSTYGLSNSTGIVYNASIEFINPSSQTGNKVCFYKEIFRQSNGTSIFFNGQGTWLQNSYFKTIKFAFTTGNFASGIVKHYIKK